MQAVAAKDTQTTTVAQALYLGAPPVHFARLVAMLDAALNRVATADRRLTWDCDDVAMFSVDGLRLVMAITDAPGTDYAACITVSAGPDGPGVDSPLLRRANGICRMIADRLAAETHPDAVLWHRVAGVATADTVDALVWRLCDTDLLSFALPPVDLPPAPTRRHEPRELRAAMFSAHDLSQPVQESTIVRLATHAANATLIAAAPPVGGAVWTMSLLQGENPRLTARAMGLTGAVLALLALFQEPVLAAMF
jgi:hypothetical protein